MDPDDPTEELDPTGKGGSVLEQFAKSHHGQTIYQLHDDGFSIAETQSGMVYPQMVVYLTAKAYWTEKNREEAKSNSGSAGTNSF